MKLSLLHKLALSAATLSAANAQVRLNEIYSRHCGPDDMEFVELAGPGGVPLDGYLFLTVEGDGDSGELGRLDNAFDLTGLTMPADGYFVIGTQGVPTVDLVLGLDHELENGTDTYYLVQTSDPAAILALRGTDVDPDGDRVTVLPSTPGVQAIETVAIVDDRFPSSDRIYDCAPAIGPLACNFGPFRPAGIFRPDDSPFGWCRDLMLDFNNTGACGGGGCPTTVMATPGTMNPGGPCTPKASSDGCGSVVSLGSIYCDPAIPNSSGLPAEISALGSSAAGEELLILTVEQIPAGDFGYFLTSMTQGGFMPPSSSGILCLGGNIGRLNQFGFVGVGPTFSKTVDMRRIPVNPPAPILAGQTWNFQCWFRDAPSNNFSNAVSVTFF